MSIHYGPSEAFPLTLGERPDSPSVHRHYADYLEEVGDLEEAGFQRALADWLEAMRADPGFHPPEDAHVPWAAPLDRLPVGVSRGLLPEYVEWDEPEFLDPHDFHATKLLDQGKYLWPSYAGMEEGLRRAYIDHSQRMADEADGVVYEREATVETAGKPGEPTAYIDTDALTGMLNQLAGAEHNLTRWGRPDGDWNFRMILADALQDVGRDQEAGWLREQGGHVLTLPHAQMGHQIFPGRPDYTVHENALASIWQLLPEALRHHVDFLHIQPFGARGLFHPEPEIPFGHAGLWDVDWLTGQIGDHGSHHHSQLGSALAALVRGRVNAAQIADEDRDTYWHWIRQLQDARHEVIDDKRIPGGIRSLSENDEPVGYAGEEQHFTNPDPHRIPRVMGTGFFPQQDWDNPVQLETWSAGRHQGLADFQRPYLHMLRPQYHTPLGGNRDPQWIWSDAMIGRGAASQQEMLDFLDIPTPENAWSWQANDKDYYNPYKLASALSPSRVWAMANAARAPGDRETFSFVEPFLESRDLNHLAPLADMLQERGLEDGYRLAKALAEGDRWMARFIARRWGHESHRDISPSRLSRYEEGESQVQYSHPAFQSSILDDPAEDTNWLVYADWLEEQGHIKEAARMRWMVRARHSLDGLERSLLPRREWSRPTGFLRHDRMMQEGIEELGEPWVNEVIGPELGGKILSHAQPPVDGLYEVLRRFLIDRQMRGLFGSVHSGGMFGSFSAPSIEVMGAGKLRDNLRTPNPDDMSDLRWMDHVHAMSAMLQSSGTEVPTRASSVAADWLNPERESFTRWRRDIDRGVQTGSNGLEMVKAFVKEDPAPYQGEEPFCYEGEAVDSGEDGGEWSELPDRDYWRERVPYAGPHQPFHPQRNPGGFSNLPPERSVFSWNRVPGGNDRLTWPPEDLGRQTTWNAEDVFQLQPAQTGESEAIWVPTNRGVQRRVNQETTDALLMPQHLDWARRAFGDLGDAELHRDDFGMDRNAFRRLTPNELYRFGVLPHPFGDKLHDPDDALSREAFADFLDEEGWDSPLALDWRGHPLPQEEEWGEIPGYIHRMYPTPGARERATAQRIRDRRRSMTSLPLVDLPHPDDIDHNATRLSRYADDATWRAAINDDPREATIHGAMADWLDEEGRAEDANFRRALALWLPSAQFVTPERWTEILNRGRGPRRGITRPDYLVGMPWILPDDGYFVPGLDPNSMHFPGRVPVHGIGEEPNWGNVFTDPDLPIFDWYRSYTGWPHWDSLERSFRHMWDQDQMRRREDDIRMEPPAPYLAAPDPNWAPPVDAWLPDPTLVHQQTDTQYPVPPTAYSDPDTVDRLLHNLQQYPNLADLVNQQPTLFWPIYDALGEAYPDNPWMPLMARTLGINRPRRPNEHWNEVSDWYWEPGVPHRGFPPRQYPMGLFDTIRLGDQGPFNTFLRQDDAGWNSSAERPSPPGFTLHATSSLPKSRGVGFGFEFPATADEPFMRELGELIGPGGPIPERIAWPDELEHIVNQPQQHHERLFRELRGRVREQEDQIRDRERYHNQSDYARGGVSVNYSHETLADMLAQLASPEHQLTRWGQGDNNFRAVMADVLQELGRDQEAEWVRSGRHILTSPEGQIHPGRFTHHPAQSSFDDLMDLYERLGWNHEQIFLDPRGDAFDPESFIDPHEHDPAFTLEGGHGPGQLPPHHVRVASSWGDYLQDWWDVHHQELGSHLAGMAEDIAGEQDWTLVEPEAWEAYNELMEALINAPFEEEDPAGYARTDYASDRDILAVLKALRANPGDVTGHGALADMLDDWAGAEDPIARLIRRQYSLGPFTGKRPSGTGRRRSFESEVPWFWRNDRDTTAHMGKHGPFDLWLAPHNSEGYDAVTEEFEHPPAWLLEAMHSPDDGKEVRHGGYTFEFPFANGYGSEAVDELSSLFPWAEPGFRDPEYFREQMRRRWQLGPYHLGSPRMQPEDFAKGFDPDEYAYGDHPMQYARPFPVGAMHPRFRSTRLGGLLWGHANAQQPDEASDIARELLLHPATERLVDETGIHALSDWLQETPNHWLAQRLNQGGRTLPDAFHMDQQVWDLASYMTGLSQMSLGADFERWQQLADTASGYRSRSRYLMADDFLNFLEDRLGRSFGDAAGKDVQDSLNRMVARAFRESDLVAQRRADWNVGVPEETAESNEASALESLYRSLNADLPPRAVQPEWYEEDEEPTDYRTDPGRWRPLPTVSRPRTEAAPPSTPWYFAREESFLAYEFQHPTDYELEPLEDDATHYAGPTYGFEDDTYKFEPDDGRRDTPPRRDRGAPLAPTADEVYPVRPPTARGAPKPPAHSFSNLRWDQGTRSFKEAGSSGIGRDRHFLGSDAGFEGLLMGVLGQNRQIGDAVHSGQLNGADVKNVLEAAYLGKSYTPRSADPRQKKIFDYLTKVGRQFAEHQRAVSWGATGKSASSPPPTPPSATRPPFGPGWTQSHTTGAWHAPDTAGRPTRPGAMVRRPSPPPLPPGASVGGQTMPGRPYPAAPANTRQGRVDRGRNPEGSWLARVSKGLGRMLGFEHEGEPTFYGPGDHDYYRQPQNVNAKGYRRPVYGRGPNGGYWVYYLIPSEGTLEDGRPLWVMSDGQPVPARNMAEVYQIAGPDLPSHERQRPGGPAFSAVPELGEVLMQPLSDHEMFDSGRWQDEHVTPLYEHLRQNPGDFTARLSLVDRLQELGFDPYDWDSIAFLHADLAEAAQRHPGSPRWSSPSEPPPPEPDPNEFGIDERPNDPPREPDVPYARADYNMDEGRLFGMLDELAGDAHRETRWGRGDRNFRAILADALQDMGRDQEAEWTRSGRRVFVDPTSMERRVLPGRPGFDSMRRAVAEFMQGQIQHGLADDWTVDPDDYLTFDYDPEDDAVTVFENVNGDAVFHGPAEEAPGRVADWLHSVYPIWHRTAQEQGWSDNLPPIEFFHPSIDAIGQAGLDLEEDTSAYGGFELPTEYGDFEDRNAFHDQILKNPFELTTHGAFADWLDDHDQPHAAERRRALMTGLQRRLSHPFTHPPVEFPEGDHLHRLVSPSIHGPDDFVMPTQSYWFGMGQGYGTGWRTPGRLMGAAIPRGMNPGDWLWAHQPNSSRFLPNEKALRAYMGLDEEYDLDRLNLDTIHRHRSPRFPHDHDAPHPDLMTPAEKAFWGLSDIRELDPTHWDEVERLFRDEWGHGLRKFSRYEDENQPTQYAPRDRTARRLAEQKAHAARIANIPPYQKESDYLDRLFTILSSPQENHTRWGLPTGDWDFRHHMADVLESLETFDSAERLRTPGLHVAPNPTAGIVRKGTFTHSPAFRELASLGRFVRNPYNEDIHLDDMITSDPWRETGWVPDEEPPLEPWETFLVHHDSDPYHPGRPFTRVGYPDLGAFLHKHFTPHVEEWFDSHPDAQSPVVVDTVTEQHERLRNQPFEQMTYARTDYGEQEDFLAAIHANPLEATGHGAFADWLDEAGMADEAAFRRALAAWVQNRPPRFVEPQGYWAIPGHFGQDFYPPGVRGVTHSHGLNEPLWDRFGNPVTGQVGGPEHGMFGYPFGTSVDEDNPGYGVFWPSWASMEDALRESFLDGLARQRQQEAASQPRSMTSREWGRDDDPNAPINRPPEQYAKTHTQPGWLHPHIRGTSLGTALNVLGAEGTADASPLAQAFLDANSGDLLTSIPAHQFPVDMEMDPLFRLADWMMENEDHPFSTRRFNWPTVPHALNRDIALRRALAAHGFDPNNRDDLDGIEDAAWHLRMRGIDDAAYHHGRGLVDAIGEWFHRTGGMPSDIGSSSWRLDSAAHHNRLLDHPNIDTDAAGFRRHSPEPFTDPAQSSLGDWWQEVIDEDPKHPDRYAFGDDAFIPYDEGMQTTYAEDEDILRDVHQNPTDLTGHLALADWYGEHDQPQKESFRRRLARWVQTRLEAEGRGPRLSPAEAGAGDVPLWEGAPVTVPRGTFVSSTPHRALRWRHGSPWTPLVWADARPLLGAEGGATHAHVINPSHPYLGQVHDPEGRLNFIPLFQQEDEHDLDREMHWTAWPRPSVPINGQPSGRMRPKALAEWLGVTGKGRFQDLIAPHHRDLFFSGPGRMPLSGSFGNKGTMSPADHMILGVTDLSEGIDPENWAEVERLMNWEAAHGRRLPGIYYPSGERWDEPADFGG